MALAPTLTTLLIAAASFATLLASAMAEDPQARLANSARLDAEHMSLGTFDKDVDGSDKSACSGPHAALWPPAMAAATDQADQKPGQRAGGSVKTACRSIQA